MLFLCGNFTKYLILETNNQIIHMKSNTLFLAVILVTTTICVSCTSNATNSANKEKVILADERVDIYIPLLAGKRVAVFSNQTGIVGDKTFVLEDKGETHPQADKTKKSLYKKSSLVPFGYDEKGRKLGYGPHIVDVLIENGVNVKAIFSPEHGFRGKADAGELVNSSVDAKTGVPIHSLYSFRSGVPSKEIMSGIDVIVVDIQDVGLRYYTYYISMYHLMEACARDGKQMLILDRPNPNGFYVDGPILDMKYKSGVGYLPIPVVHGMTFGELALMINGEKWLAEGMPCNLKVVKCENYTHNTKYELIVAPSPNLKDMNSVYLYSSTCFFEGTKVSLGRGTAFPFEVYGHPQMKGYDFNFTPMSVSGAKNPKFKDEKCFGVDLRTQKDEEIWAKGMNLSYVVDAYTNLISSGAIEPEQFFRADGFFNLLSGVSYIKDMILEGKTAKEIKECWQDDVAEFKKLRKPYLLYEE